MKPITAFTIARILSGLAFILGLAGGVLSDVAIARLSGSPLDTRVLWTLVPVLSGGFSFLLARRPHYEPLMLLAGSIGGFTVLGGFSIGGYFAPSALLLLMAAMANMTAVPARPLTVLFPIWFLTGATGVCATFLLASWHDGQANAAPVVVAGTKLFAILVVGLGLVTLAARRVATSATAK